MIRLWDAIRLNNRSLTCSRPTRSEMLHRRDQNQVPRRRRPKAHRNGISCPRICVALSKICSLLGRTCLKWKACSKWWLGGGASSSRPYDVARRASCAPLSWASTNSARRPQTNAHLTLLPFELIVKRALSRSGRLNVSVATPSGLSSISCFSIWMLLPKTNQQPRCGRTSARRVVRGLKEALTEDERKRAVSVRAFTTLRYLVGPSFGSRVKIPSGPASKR